MKKPKVITLFNHKGGVSKTTTTVTLGWALAEQGKKVMMVDADAQCNLTQFVVGLEEVASFYETGKGMKNNIYELIKPAIKGEGPLVAPEVKIHKYKENLYLLPGSQDIEEASSQLTVALKAHEGLTPLKLLPGILGNQIRRIAMENEIDIVLIDLSPSRMALNQCLLFSSDYFIIPAAPDYFCYQAILSLSDFIPQWDKDLNFFRNKDDNSSFKTDPPKLLGIICQRYKKYTTTGSDMPKAVEVWRDKIVEAVEDTLAVALNKNKMMISSDQFSKFFSTERKPYLIAEIPDFNTLVSVSQTNALPVIALEGKHIKEIGIVLSQQLDSIETFRDTFSKIATSVITICDE